MKDNWESVSFLESCPRINHDFELGSKCFYGTNEKVTNTWLGDELLATAFPSLFKVATNPLLYTKS